MTEEWKALDDNQKGQYVQASDREKQRYNREMLVFREKVAKEVAADIEKNPKKPKSPFFCYVKAHYAVAKTEQPLLPHKDIMKVSLLAIPT